jgi:transcriptional regulator with XRE-family HTH domain
MTGHELKQLRLKTELSQHKLSQKIGIHLKTLQRWERENWKIQAKYLPRIRGIFDLAVKERFANHETPEQKESLRQQRVEIMERMDRKVERWGDLPNDDPDLIAFRKVVGAK